MDELKKCPFCGGVAKLLDELALKNGFNKLYYVKCTSCGCMTKKSDTNYKALIIWNTRTEN